MGRRGEGQARPQGRAAAATTRVGQPIGGRQCGGASADPVAQQPADMCGLREGPAARHEEPLVAV
eukprot:12671492-Alexandrium_andersonii.AAC.1